MWVVYTCLGVRLSVLVPEMGLLADKHAVGALKRRLFGNSAVNGDGEISSFGSGDELEYPRF